MPRVPACVRVREQFMWEGDSVAKPSAATLSKFYHLDGKVLRFSARLADGAAAAAASVGAGGATTSGIDAESALARLFATHGLTPVQVCVCVGGGGCGCLPHSPLPV